MTAGKRYADSLPGCLTLKDMTMTDQRIDGAATDLGGKAQEYYGRAIDGLDGLDGLVERAPADLREPARTGLDFARRKPLLTTGILAGLVLLLAGSGRRR